MNLHADLSTLPITIERDGQQIVYTLSVILDPQAGPTLVDAALPNTSGLIADGLAELGLTIADLRRIIITHQDLDHVGALAELVALSGATVLAHSEEAPYIDGRLEPLKFAMLRQRPGAEVILAQFRPTAIDHLLQDGDRLDPAGGIRVVATPGHSPGHICLYLERSRILIAGDALTASEGVLRGPNAAMTPNMAEAARSVAKLAGLDVAAIVCHHGGVVQADANGQLKRLALELGAA